MANLPLYLAFDPGLRPHCKHLGYCLLVACQMALGILGAAPLNGLAFAMHSR
jgi:hypothetical protein